MGEGVQPVVSPQSYSNADLWCLIYFLSLKKLLEKNNPSIGDMIWGAMMLLSSGFNAYKWSDIILGGLPGYRYIPDKNCSAKGDMYMRVQVVGPGIYLGLWQPA